MEERNDRITFGQAQGLIAWVSPIAIVALGGFSGFLVGTTQTEAEVAALRQDVDRMQSVMDSRGSFMECAIREIDRLDIQSTDPNHNRIDASFRSNTSTGFFGSDFEFNSPPLLSEVLLEMRGKVAFLIEAKGTNATRIRDCARSRNPLPQSSVCAAFIAGHL